MKPYLLTPIINPQTPPERRYNYSHSRTRNTVERSFGVWKRRFACLSLDLRIKVETVLALAILRNIARMRNDIFGNDDNSSEDDSDNDSDTDVNDGPLRGNGNRLGNAVRRNIIAQYFTNV